KMSKSKGNVVDPMVKIDQFGSDAFRMGIISDETPGSYRPYDESKLVGARNFCNKLWNIARYIEDAVGEETDRAGVHPRSAADHWILSRLDRASQTVFAHLDSYRFSEAYETLYHFVWDDVADWFVEASKAAPNKPLLAFILEAALTLAHPFAPFLTETIWQTLAWEGLPAEASVLRSTTKDESAKAGDSLLATRTFASVPKYDSKHVKDFTEIQSIIGEIRSIVNTLRVSGVTLYHTGVPFLNDNAELIKRLAKLQGVTEVKDGDGMYLTNTEYRCWLDIDAGTARAYLKELDAQKTAQEAAIKRLESRLANKNYVKNAPRAVVAQTKDQLAAAKGQLEKIWQEYKRFNQ
ncbi:MAG TPA: class I tRNA ligase family protein, partial [Candidatus Saccharimonadales bacterium]|nr:class I tRNA ligase family protein [Candidatus Saccharimonadales bacterium]